VSVFIRWCVCNGFTPVILLLYSWILTHKKTHKHIFGKHLGRCVDLLNRSSCARAPARSPFSIGLVLVTGLPHRQGSFARRNAGSKRAAESRSVRPLLRGSKSIFVSEICPCTSLMMTSDRYLGCVAASRQRISSGIRLVLARSNFMPRVARQRLARQAVLMLWIEKGNQARTCGVQRHGRPNRTRARSGIL
jgi:hypothetical protein